MLKAYPPIITELRATADHVKEKSNQCFWAWPESRVNMQDNNAADIVQL